MSKNTINVMIAAISLTVLIPISSFSATVGPTSTSHDEAIDDHGIKIVHATELKKWIDSGKSIQLIDARPKKFDKGQVILGARFLPYDSEDAKIKAALPSKDALIVVYCASIKCPASQYLGKELVKMGYTNVYRYPEGLNEWSEKGLPTGKPAP